MTDPDEPLTPVRSDSTTAPEDRSRLFELSNDLLATIDDQGCFADVNPAWQTVLGWERADLIGMRAVDLVHPEDRARTLELNDSEVEPASEVHHFENRYRCKDGTYRWLQWNGRLLAGRWYAVARDVTDRRVLEERANRDPLTGLPNRTSLTERLDVAIARLARRPGLVSILFVDLDRFKVINDGRGHDAGDRFLCAAAARLMDTVRDVDSVARFGGDEFVVLLEDVRDADFVNEVAARVVIAFEQPIAIDSEEEWVGASVGVATTTTAGSTPATVLHEADIAMYRAKSRGGGCFEVFDGKVRADVEQRVTAARELRVAVEEHQFVLHYQPIVTLPETSVSRCEALVRWQHPSRGLLLPGEFLPVAEETGLIVRMGEWVLIEACKQARRWRREGRDIAITVNVSTRQLDRPDFGALVERVLSDTKLPPAALCLEITETELMKHAAKIAPSLEGLRRLGVRIAIDDFGSGYSSLTYLRVLPVDIIKIDKSFVRGILDDPQDRAIVAGIVNLGRETSRSVIAEGVETESLHGELVRLGCDLAQGFLYDRARPPEELSLDGYSSRVRPGLGDPTVIREFMRQIGIPARMLP